MVYRKKNITIKKIKTMQFLIIMILLITICTILGGIYELLKEKL